MEQDDEEEWDEEEYRRQRLRELLDQCDRLSRRDPTTTFLNWTGVTTEQLRELWRLDQQRIERALNPERYSEFLETIWIDVSIVDSFVLGLLGSTLRSSPGLETLRLCSSSDSRFYHEEEERISNTLLASASRSSSLRTLVLHLSCHESMDSDMMELFLERTAITSLTINASREVIPTHWLADVAHGLEDNHSIRHLSLSMSPLNAGLILSGFYRRPESLEHLELCLTDDPWGRRSVYLMQSLAHLVEKSTELCSFEIDVYNNRCDLSLLCRALSKNNSIETMRFGFEEDPEPPFRLGETLCIEWEKFLRSEQLKLRDLTVEGGGFGTDFAIATTNGLAANKSLRTFTMYPSRLYTGFGSEAFRHNSTMGALTLKSCDVDGSHVAGLASGLKSNTALRTLCLDFNPIETAGLLPLLEALETNNCLQDLSLRCCGIEGLDAAPAIRLLLIRNTGLRRLDLRYNDVIGVSGGSLVADGIVNNETLEDLDLGWNPMSRQCARFILSALEQNRTLRSLCLAGVGLQSTMVGQHVKNLVENSQLESLDLRRNPIGGEGIKMLALGIRESDTLRKLELGGCDFGGADLQFLGEALTANTTVEHVSFTEPEFDSSAIRAFVRLLPRMRRVREIQGICIDDEDTALLLSESLQMNTVLRSFSPTSDSVKMSTRREIEFYLTLNRRGRQLLRSNEDGFEVPMGLWPHILSRVSSQQDSRFMYYLLRHKTELIPVASAGSNARPSKRQKVSN